MKKKIILLNHVILMCSTISLSQGSGNCLQFDGVDDYIRVPFTLVKSNSSHTIEMWVNSSSSETGAIYSEANSASNYKGQFRLAGNGSGKLVLYYMPSKTILVNNVTSTTTVFDDTWHHVALVGNGNSTMLYIDGVADATNFDYVRPTNAEAIEAGVGAQVRCCYATGNFSQPFSGRIDEVRLWSTSRPISSIRSNMTKKLGGNHSRLEVYYRLDQSSGTDVTDDSETTPSIDGSLAHDNLSAPYASWELSGAPLGDESAFSYSVTGSTSLNLTSSYGDNFEANVTSIISTPNSIHLYRVDSPPNPLTPPGTQNQLSETHYYGVKVFGGTGVVYSVVFNYDGHTGITDENTLELAKRDDNSDLTWSQEIAVLNTTANTLTLTGQTGTEYILATGGDNPLPIELISFQAELLKDEIVELTWVTASEINNDYFTIERSADRTSWEIIDKVKGAGNSEQQISYSTIDSFPYNGVTYYRLKQTDFDGQYKYFDVRMITLDILSESRIRIFPNPIENKAILRGNNNDIERIEVYNALGQEVTGNIEILERNKSELLLNLSNLRRGIFYVKTKSSINRIYKR